MLEKSVQVQLLSTLANFWEETYNWSILLFDFQIPFCEANYWFSMRDALFYSRLFYFLEFSTINLACTQIDQNPYFECLVRILENNGFTQGSPWNPFWI